MPNRITKPMARRFLLSYQHLLKPRELEGKQGILQYFRRVGCVQYDPLNIVGRNAELILQARVRQYKSGVLEELLYSDRLLVDGWDKMMSIYPAEDWPFFRRVRQIRERQIRGTLERRNSRQALTLMGQIREQIEKEGALSSNDFKLGSVNPGRWGHGKLASAALDYMFQTGQLGIERKINTRKVYNTVERLLPERIYNHPDPFKNDNEFYQWYCLRRIGSVGLVWNRRSDAWLGYILENSEHKDRAIESLLERGLITEISIDGLESPCYIHKAQEKALLSSQYCDPSKEAAIIAPLDNLIWDRAFIKALFDFSYSWEVYVPVPKRKYGYYVLPVLYGDRFIARFEPVKDKAKEALIIKNWWWEEGVSVSKSMQKSIIACMKAFLEYLGFRCLRVEQGCSVDLTWLDSCFNDGRT